jgi:acetolactate synthase-1/2/3 large subunit
MIKLSDYLTQFLANSDQVAHDVFLVSGGGMMHLLDSLGRCEKLRYICNHHEQACSMAAEGFARLSNKIGVAFVTTGPGGTNAVTGVMGAWVDSIPMLVVSGQVKQSTTINAQPRLRQLGDQEINIVDIVRPITKYAVMVNDPASIRYHLEKALHLAKSDRPGPVWLDIPLDVQAAMIDEMALKTFDPAELGETYDKKHVDLQVDELLAQLYAAKRPVFVVGNGIRLAGAAQEFLQLAEHLNVPVLTAISGTDLIPSDHPLYAGRPGILGARAANFVMQNSDLLMVLGSRMNIRIIGYAFETIAREAVKVMVDIDPEELNKPTFKPDIKIQSDLQYFVAAMLQRSEGKTIRYQKPEKWLAYCARLRDKYPAVTTEHRAMKEYVSSHYFAKVLSDFLPPDAVVVTGNGTAYTSTFQAMPIKLGQRLIANVGCAAMGFDLPAAIGACFAHQQKMTVCITGDGSIQMNLQELQTIVHHKLPIKIFMFNNQGYVSIKLTQESFFCGLRVGSCCDSGVTMPDMVRLAEVYGLSTARIEGHVDMNEKIQAVIHAPGPVLCEVMLDPLEKLYPKAFSEKRSDGTLVSRPLEDLYPFLPRDEFNENMIIKPLDVE